MKILKKKIFLGGRGWVGGGGGGLRFSRLGV